MERFLTQQLGPLVESIKKPKEWDWKPPGTQTETRVQAYVGLRNLGCICYMNSMMQQFYMIPCFRYNLLCIDDGVQPNIQEYRNEMFDDNMFHQMQRLIAHLELSERHEYNPLGFCFAFKEFDGSPTKIAE